MDGHLRNSKTQPAAFYLINELLYYRRYIIIYDRKKYMHVVLTSGIWEWCD